MSQRIMMSGARITLQGGREVTLATEMGHPCRTAAQPAGKGLGFGGRPVLGANSDCSRVTWGKTSHSPELPQTPDRGNNFIPLWIKWDSPRKSPWPLQASAKRLSPGNPGGMGSGVGARAWAGSPEAAKKRCPATSLPSAEAARNAPSPGGGDPVSSLLCVHQWVPQRDWWLFPTALRAFCSHRADRSTYPPPVRLLLLALAVNPVSLDS